MAEEVTESTVADAVELLDGLFPQHAGELLQTEAGKRILSFRNELFKITWTKIDMDSAKATNDVDREAKLTREEVEDILSRMCELSF